mgnify:FL=1
MPPRVARCSAASVCVPAETEVADFWRNPPWQGGRTPFRMGLQRVPSSAWLADPIDEVMRERKVRLMAERGREVADQEADTEDVQRQVVAAMASELFERPAFARVRPRDPERLAETALWVPDDLCLLVPSPDGYRLVAASLCSPSYWRLQEKLGRTIQGVHAAVPGLNEAVGDGVARFFDRLPVGTVFQRRNWNIHRGNHLFHPQNEDWSAPLAVADCESLYMRSETQTLRKYAKGPLLFTIRVRCFPLAQIADYPGAAGDLLTAIGRLSPEERQASVFAHHGEALARYLRAFGSAVET